MSSRPRSRWVTSVLALAAAGATLRAPANVVWSGLGQNLDWTTGGNWEGGVAPANDGTEQIVFGPAQQRVVLVNASQSIRRLRFDFTSGSTRTYSLAGLAGATLTLGGDGIEARSDSSSGGGTATFESSLGLVLGAAQTWSVDAGSRLNVSGNVSGSGPLTLTGNGYVELSGSNSHTGGTTLEGGALGIENDSALGTGSLSVTGAASLYSNSGSRLIANALRLSGGLLELLPYGGDFRFTGNVTLGAHTTLTNRGHPVYFSGPITETGNSRGLSISGRGPVVLSGANTYTGGTSVLGGTLVFSNAVSIPATGALSSSNDAYVGIAFNTGVQGSFISKLSAAEARGTIGFDTAPEAVSATVYTEPVDLSGLNASARIGTATRATFAPHAVITPALLGGYQFGGGGGTLRIESRLTGVNALTVDSSATRAPLTLVVTNTGNDYSGLTTVTNAALVFGAGAVSGNSSIGSFVLGSGGYIGSSDPALSLATWLAKFSLTTITQGVIGFDSADVSAPRTVTGSFDLSPFILGTNIALGTSSAATLSGTITLPVLQNNYVFTGYKGGWLTVDASLGGSRGVQLGDASGVYPDFDPNDSARQSTVFLNGSNSHSGGTTLFNGRLVLGHSSALGSGSLVIDGSGANALPRIETSLVTNPTFGNQMVVNHDVAFAGDNSFGWAGNILNGVNTGVIRKYGAANVTLAGNNSGFTGGFQINEGTLTFASNTASGSGRLDLGSSNGIAIFTSADPSINGLSGGSNAASVTIAGGSTLTINQTSDSVYRGQLAGAGSMVKTGAGALRFETAGTFTGVTAIKAGTLDVAKSGALGTSSIVLDGAASALKLGSGVTLANSVAFGSGGGRLSGHGAFSSPVVIGANSVIAPGSSVGTLTFTSGLTLTSGGSYDFEVQNATGGPGVGWDFVQVNGPLTFTATPTAPFTLNLISLSSSGAIGNPANFQSTTDYSWAIASATSFVNFDAAAVSLNLSNFTPGLNGGTFNLSTSGNNLLLTFTPVPEPSTWALFLAGLGLIGLRKLRRRR